MKNALQILNWTMENWETIAAVTAAVASLVAKLRSDWSNEKTIDAMAEGVEKAHSRHVKEEIIRAAKKRGPKVRKKIERAALKADPKKPNPPASVAELVHKPFSRRSNE